MAQVLCRPSFAVLSAIDSAAPGQDCRCRSGQAGAALLQCRIGLGKPVSSRFAVDPVVNQRRQSRFATCAVQEDRKSDTQAEENLEDVTKKYGLEWGLWKALTSKKTNPDGTEAKSSGEQAKELLKKYGSAYLATSISLSLVSFTLCYALINSGVDVADLLSKVNIEVNSQGEAVGTFALAYAAHKALSPVRFPPTVALTPVVANWLGKKVEGDNEKGKE